MASNFQSSSEINSLPENILLEVFRWLPIKDLCTIGRVCKKWRRVIDDNSLWRRVDLRPYKLNLHKMWKVIRAHFSDVLRSLHLRGYTNPASISWKKHSLSDAMLSDLQARCPGLSELELVWTSLEGIRVSGMPHHLTTLTITDSLVPVGWFHGASAYPFSKTLTHLDLSRSTRTANQDMVDIAQFKQLRTLKVNFCYRVSEAGLTAVANHLTELRVLEVAETRCTDVCLHCLSRSLSLLERLNISGCEEVTDSGLATAALCLKGLRVLYLVKCKQVTDVGLEHLTKAQSLHECDVTRTGVTAAGVETLAAKLPKCHVIYESDEYVHKL